ncbi:MAG: NusG domain II-containing protein [Bacillota bacterium]|nr:NusG domain II-containing protein [Bacillota bacterium]
MKRPGLLTPLDGLLILALLAAGAAGLWLVRGVPGNAAAAGRWARVEVDGRTVARVPLDGPRQEWVQGRWGKVLLEADTGRIRVKDEQPLCPRRICLSTGWVSRPGQPIVCVPNHLVVRVEGGSPAGEGSYDAVTW